MKKLIGIIKLMRIKHYVKNGLIFLPLFFSMQLFDPALILKCILGFFAFSFISSVVYIINDLRDKEKDKLHSKKCKRPIASGLISVPLALAVAAILIIISGVLLVLIGSLIGAVLTVLFDGDIRETVPQTLMLAGSDGRFFPASGTILDGNTLEVTSAQVAAPCRVRYGWSDNPQHAGMYGTNGLQISPFEVSVND